MNEIRFTTETIARLVFKKEEVLYEINDEINNTEPDKLYLRLCELLDDGYINDAENTLFDSISNEDPAYLQVAVDFYSRLNSLDDSTLEQGGFSRHEIESGIAEIETLFGLSL